MCLAVPGRIIKTSGDVVTVDFQGNRMDVSRVLTPDAGPDDWVLVHAGFAIAVIDEAQARETWSYLNQMSAMKASDAGEDVENTGG